MKKELELKMPRKIELEREQLQEVEGGLPIPWTEVIKGIAIGIGIAAGHQVMVEWDDFKDGFASAFN